MLALTDVRAFVGIIDEGETEEDVLIQQFLDSAKDYIARYTRRDLDAEFGPEFPASLLQAQRLLVAHYYRFREAGTPGASDDIPFGVKDLLADFRAFT